MAGFTKFDPRAFIETEQRAAADARLDRTAKDALYPPSNLKTLAALAPLAASPPKNENEDVGQSSTNADHRHHGENRKSEPSPAKVAKAAKVESSVYAEDDASWGEIEEEHAAVIEYDGEVTRAWAEALARLDSTCPPCDIPPKRWLHFIDDCGRFLDDGWAACAERLGWTPLDLFGCDRTKPFGRVDHAGLLWLLNGQKLLALTADAAAIATPSGGTLKYRRCPDEPGRVLAWELSREADLQ